MLCKEETNKTSIEFIASKSDREPPIKYITSSISAVQQAI